MKNLYQIYRKRGDKWQGVARVRAISNYSARFKYMIEMKRTFLTQDKVTDFKARLIKGAKNEIRLSKVFRRY